MSDALKREWLAARGKAKKVLLHDSQYDYFIAYGFFLAKGLPPAAAHTLAQELHPES